MHKIYVRTKVSIHNTSIILIFILYEGIKYHIINTLWLIRCSLRRYLIFTFEGTSIHWFGARTIYYLELANFLHVWFFCQGWSQKKNRRRQSEKFVLKACFEITKFDTFEGRRNKKEIAPGWDIPFKITHWAGCCCVINFLNQAWSCERRLICISSSPQRFLARDDTTGK